MLSAIRTILIRSAIIMRQLTWPGSFFHELAHQLACYAAGHKVLEVRYIIRNDPEALRDMYGTKGLRGWEGSCSLGSPRCSWDWRYGRDTLESQYT